MRVYSSTVFYPKRMFDLNPSPKAAIAEFCGRHRLEHFEVSLAPAFTMEPCFKLAGYRNLEEEPCSTPSR
jgi:hypothetical protein